MPGIEAGAAAYGRQASIQPVHLVLPRTQLDAWLASTTPAPIAHARLVCSTTSTARWVTPIGGLLAGAPRRHQLPPGALTDDGTLVLTWAARSTDPPASTADWTAWLARETSGFRLASDAVSPVLAALWLREDGLAAAAWRDPGRVQPWQPVARLLLPGAEMLNLPVHPGASVAELEVHDVGEPGPRYSRQAGALGAEVLARMQRSRFALVGVGRTGSALAHSLARMGGSLLCIDPDTMEAHNLDADLPPLHEGLPKVQALAWQLRGLMRPGATLQTQVLPVSSPAIGPLLAEADIVLCCVDNDAARLWANAWALALHKPLLDVATGVHAHGAEADLRLLLPGRGCLSCMGGFAQQADLPRQLQQAMPPATPGDFRRQRRGSLRSWAQVSANLGLRMVEQVYAGARHQSTHRRLAERSDGGLAVDDWADSFNAAEVCPLCGTLSGGGLAAVHRQRVADIAHALSFRSHAGPAP